MDLQQRLSRIDLRLANLQQREARYPWLRLGLLVLGLLAIYLAFNLLPPVAAWIVVVLALAAFLIAAYAHHQIIAAITRYQALRALTLDRLARAALDWPNVRPPLPVEVPPEHPFNRDLLVTGPRSLHHLLDTPASLGGSQRLADWLLDPSPDLPHIQRRQALVQELISRPGLRARLALDGYLIHTPAPAAAPAKTAPAPAAERFDAAPVLSWLHADSQAASLRPILIVLFLLSAANILLFLLNAFGLLPPYFIATFALYFFIQAARFRQAAELFDEAYGLARRLGQFRAILADLETYPFPPGLLLSRLAAPFYQSKQCPSRILRRVSLIAVAASLRNNPFFALILNMLVPWDLFFAYQLERFKTRVRSLLPVWLDAWYQIEALSALAGFATQHPRYTFPAFLPLEGLHPVFSARALGHPLIPANARVTNDFTLPALGDIILITGSNMSGKSTFLRTVGANLVLAYAGAPVAAAELRARPLRLYTSMNVSNSLSDGISYFYAEVRRLKALLEALRDDRPLPLLYLIDEIFRGTNNRERRLGSESYLRALAGGHGAGLISTHDLELVHLADEIPQLTNDHFREDIHDGRMVFDYRLRPGPSPTTNALRIMALAGLPVPPESS